MSLARVANKNMVTVDVSSRRFAAQSISIVRPGPLLARRTHFTTAVGPPLPTTLSRQIGTAGRSATPEMMAPRKRSTSDYSGSRWCFEACGMAESDPYRLA